MNNLKAPITHAATILVILLGLAGSFCSAVVDTCADDGYSMYVWTNGFNPSADHCGGIYPINKAGLNATCFQHSWETSSARQKLWASCTQPGRKVTRLFVSDMNSRIQNNGYADAAHTCDTDLMALLSEAHQLGIRVYALFAASDAAFSEKDMAAYPRQFNTNCGTDTAYFDGVSVNNEHFANLRDCTSPPTALQQQHLDLLQETANNAAPLPLHFSVSWNWEYCSFSQNIIRYLEWPANSGVTKSVVQHMIDIVDSVDVQVAYIKNDTMVDRSTNPYNYWEAKVGKSDTSKIYVLSYTNPTSLCQTSYSPHIETSTTVTDECNFSTINPRTEAGMFQGFDYVEGMLVQMKGSIHFMQGVYGSGITADWPAHTMPDPAPSCTTRPGTCSDGTGSCSTLEDCVCGASGGRTRNMLGQTANQYTLRGMEENRPAERNLGKPVKTNRPTPPPLTNSPTKFPTSVPTHKPTQAPLTNSPTKFPTSAPTHKPTQAPLTNSPTKFPTSAPTHKPTQFVCKCNLP